MLPVLSVFTGWVKAGRETRDWNPVEVSTIAVRIRAGPSSRGLRIADELWLHCRAEDLRPAYPKMSGVRFGLPERRTVRAGFEPTC